jgi:adenylate cyclase
MSENGSKAELSIFRSHSFYIKIVSTFVGLLLLTVLPIIWCNYIEGERLVREFSNDLLIQVSNTVTEKAENYFLPASISVETGSLLSRIKAISCNDRDQVELYTLGVLKSYPQISMFYFADDTGTLFRGWRFPDGNMETRIIDKHATPPVQIFRYRDAGFKLIASEESSEIDYDPRVRPWFVGAKQTGSNFWTDLYVLARNKKPAITSSCPMIDENGKFQGAWAMDIELDEMCGFLQNMKIGKSGIALIINEKNQVIAYPELSRMIKEENGTVRPIRVEELGVASITEAFRQHVATGKSRCEVETGGEKFFASFSELPKSFPARWKIGVVVPENDFTGPAKLMMTQIILICIAILLIAVLLALYVSKSISKPIRLLAEETRKIRNFELGEKVLIVTYIKEIQLMHDAISSMKNGLRAFRRYVPAELVRQLIHTGDEARLGGQKKELTVFVSDIAGFTSIAERIPTEELMVHLSVYFDELTQILISRKGTIDKYIGDAILAFWGAPLPDDDHAYNACAAALACREKIENLNRKWDMEGKSPFPTRIGISTGETMVGNVGSSERINYTVMGDNVNLAHRLEGASKVYGTQILVTGKTREAVADRFWFRPVGIVSVKGKKQKTPVFELMGFKIKGENGDTAELCTEFSRGFEAYLARDWEEACNTFKKLSMRFPTDAPTNFYLSRCEQFKDNPPGPGWRGVEYVESK